MALAKSTNLAAAPPVTVTHQYPTQVLRTTAERFSNRVEPVHQVAGYGRCDARRGLGLWALGSRLGPSVRSPGRHTVIRSFSLVSAALLI